jgi:NADH-quinone oxidoreductase subunit N
MSNLLHETIPAAPEIFLTLWAMLLLLIGVFQKKRESQNIPYLALVGLIITSVMVFSFNEGTYSAFNDLFLVTPFTQVMKCILLISTAAVLYMTHKHFAREQMNRYEYSILLLFASVGMMIMISAQDLLSAFLGLELQSLSLYIMVALARDRLASNEAGIKYFTLGALASCFFLFGASYIYGYAGTTQFRDVALVLEKAQELPIYINFAFLMLLVTMGFKISLVPFHMWTPDVYEGSPTPVTVFLASAPKLAGFVLLTHILTLMFGGYADIWMPVLQGVAILTIVVGAFAALFQKKLKRLLAYSAISHVGFALLGFLSDQGQEYENIFNYLIIYIIMTVGSFGVLLSLRKRGHLVETIEDLAGLSEDAPFLALCMTILLFSLAGVPPFAGFFAKLAVFKNAVSGDYYGVVILAVLASVVSAAYYLRLIKAMYFDVPVGREHALKVDRNIPLSTRLVLISAVVLVTFYVLFPQWLTLPAGKYFL